MSAFDPTDGFERFKDVIHLPIWASWVAGTSGEIRYTTPFLYIPRGSWRVVWSLITLDRDLHRGESVAFDPENGIRFDPPGITRVKVELPTYVSPTQWSLRVTNERTEEKPEIFHYKINSALAAGPADPAVMTTSDPVYIPPRGFRPGRRPPPSLPGVESLLQSTIWASRDDQGGLQLLAAPLWVPPGSWYVVWELIDTVSPATPLTFDSGGIAITRAPGLDVASSQPLGSNLWLTQLTNTVEESRSVAYEVHTATSGPVAQALWIAAVTSSSSFD